MPSPLFLDAAGCLLGFLGLLALGWTSYVAASGFQRRSPLSIRWASAVLWGLWFLTAVFWTLAPLGWFRLPVLLAVFGGALAWSEKQGGREARESLSRDLRRSRAVMAELGWVRWLAITTAVPYLLLFLRSVIAPPLAWDSLTYHLVHAGRYVQTGGLGRAVAPDAWGYYEYYPPGGDLLWSYPLMLMRNGGLLWLASAAIHGALVVVLVAAARELGVGRRAAVLGALVLASSPSILGFATTSYVDTILALLVALGLVFLFRWQRQDRAIDLVSAAAAFSLAAGVKHSALIVLAFAAVAALPNLRGRSPRFLLLVFLAVASVSLPGTAPYVRAAAETGNPFFPFSRLGFEGNEQYRMLLSGEIGPPLTEPEAFDLLEGSVFGSPDPIYPHRNFGLGLLLLIPLAVGGALSLGRARPAAALFLVAVSVVTVLMLLSGEVVALRIHWWNVSGRLMAPALVCVALLAVCFRSRWGPVLLATIVPLSLLAALPLGLGPLGWRQAGAATVLLGLVGMVALRSRRLRGMRRWAFLAVCVFLLGALQGVTRSSTRTLTYRELAKNGTFDGHPIVPYLVAWPLWTYLDRGLGYRVAVTAGFSEFGHNVLAYPLLGSRLQNTLEYIPVTGSGEVLDYARSMDLVSRLDEDAWFRRILEGDIDYVVVLPPVTVPEAAWIAARPERFEVVMQLPGGGGFLARPVRPGATF